MDYPVTEEQIKKLRRRQLEILIEECELPITISSRMSLMKMRELIIQEFSYYDKDELEDIFIPSGNHSSINGKDQIYESPSGTDLFIVMDEMIKGVYEDTLNRNIRDFGISVNDLDEDDYDDEDEKPTEISKDNSADRSFDMRFNTYDEENSSEFEKRTKMKYIRTVNPEMFFNFVKSRISEVQKVNLENRIKALASGIKSAEIIGQQGLYEELALKLSGITREQEASVIGCGKWIPYIAINFFMNKVNGSKRSNDKKIVKFDFLKRFPRVIPEAEAKKIKEVQDSNVFDQLYILYNAPAEVTPIETTKEKIRKKDPIVFGAFQHQPDRLYYVCDWIDEYCDITLDSFIKVVEENPDMIPKEIENEITQEYINKVIEDVNKSHLRLKKTNIGNYRRLMKMEEQQRNKVVNEIKEMAPEVKKNFDIISWMKGFFIKE